MSDLIKSYKKGDLEVVWQPGICTHSGRCARSLAAVFNPKRRPWIDLEASDKQSIIDTVNHCPSEALSLGSASLAESDIATEKDLVELSVIENGPVLVKGEVSIKLADGSEETKNSLALCRCGASNNKPFCDGSHAKSDFVG